ncbi:MAG TPA: sigma-54 dependent transcriptional regulator [Candidatus Polarisedimenticolaceae bacterium]|nr:sigma-54 dependent transcriptional regulator [Candidatus Polarisedimenticolaceae bacterium]
MASERILIVDDEPGVRTALEGILRDEGFTVATAASGEEGLEALASTPADAVLLDVWLPGMDGLETLLRLRERRVDAEVVMISGHGTIETAVKATRLGAFDFIEKPLSLDKTLVVLRNALRQRRLERKNRHLLDQLARDTEIVGHSASAERLRAEIAAAAEADAPVLLVGERGAGRETVARRIHAASSRAGEGFAVIPCAALDEGGAARALFGEGGTPSRFAMAAGGSVYLEEVERLPAALQERLAAQVERAHEQVRLLASVAPEASTLRGALRERLDVLRLTLPPLRDRREDIPANAERYLRELSREYGRPGKRLSPAAMAALRAADWPGNLRELRHAVERAVLLSSGDTIGVEDLPEAVGGVAERGEDLYGTFPSLAEGLAAFERAYVRRTLAAARGDREEAAQRLGMSEADLLRRLDRLSLS